MDLLIVLALAFGVLWLMTRRTRRTQREAASFRAELGPGVGVMTGSGLFGTVVEVDGDVITIETSPGVTSQWLRAAIAKQSTPADHGAGVVEDEEYDEDAYEGEYDDESDEGYESDDQYDQDDEDAEYVEDEDVVEGTPLADGALDVPDDASSLTDEDDRR